MPRRARIHFSSLRSSLVNLPISIYGPLVERSVRPQSLAVHLTVVGTQNEAYVGWTGMASASSLAQFNVTSSADKGLETIEIDPQYAAALGFKEGDTVEIGLLHNLNTAKSVGTEPLTADDWDIIEIHASHVESTLLSQVRVAKVGQEIDVWVLGRTRCRLKIVSLDPQDKGNNALLLTTNTEVSIAPKVHRKASKASSATITPEPAEEKVSTGLDSPQVLRLLPPWILPIPLPSYSGAELVGYVCNSTFKKLFPQDTSRNASCRPVTVTLFPAPNDPSSGSTDVPVPVQPTILKPSDAEKPAVSVGQETYIAALDGVPSGHVIFPSVVDGVEDWDLVSLSGISSGPSIGLTLDDAEIKENSRSLSCTPFLAGIEPLLSRCADFCISKLATHSTKKSIRGVSALLLTGQPGSGKTSIARSVAQRLQHNPKTLTYTYYVDVSKYAEKPIHTVKALFKYWFHKALWHKPSILILDNLHKLLSAQVEHAESFRSRHITEIFFSIYSSSARSAATDSRGLVLIGTAPSASDMHSLVSSMHVFEEVVHVRPPNRDARKDILAQIVQKRLEAAVSIAQDPDSPLNYAYLATQTEGYSATDLQDLVARAVHQVAIRSVTTHKPTSLTLADFDTAQLDFVPLNLRDVKLQKSTVGWSDIGGLHEVRRVLRETLEWPTKYGPIFAQSPLRLRSGLLLYGYPGCGKTLLASAVAKECGLNFISVKGPEVLNKYIGASEKTVRDLFERASAAKPCVLFFDEFDSIAPKRGHDSTGVTDRVVNQMLTQMDGAEGLDGVYVLAATSRPDLIDSALLRPGRLDKSLLCDIPDAADRQSILEAVVRKLPVSSEVDLGAIADATEGYSGADLQALVYNANLELIHSSISKDDGSERKVTRQDDAPLEYTSFGGPAEKGTSTVAEETAFQRRLRQIRISSQRQETDVKVESHPGIVKPKLEIMQKHFDKVLQTSRPSVSLEERQRLGRIYTSFISDRSGNMPVPPDGSGVGNRVSLM
ncbi:P-loop containing nucleoside triphosphate hydrolase protein [Mycena floridula]|nr:P-loop containing nucleoside triphosphate hydrolase protein [Mycena floridula]